MTHSRQRMSLDGYPPEVKQLIERHGGIVSAAEKAAGVSIRTFYKFYSGKRSFTDEMKARVMTALNNKPGDTNPMSSKLVIPNRCPPLLAQIVKKHGSKVATRNLLGIGQTTFNHMIDGKVPVPAATIIKIKADLGHSVIGAPLEPEAPKSTVPAAPEFVPWDGKEKITVSLKPKAGQKTGRKVSVPKPLGLLIQKFPNLSAVAQSMGHTSGALTGMLDDPTRFNDKWQRKVHAALHGLTPTSGTSMGEEYDKYALDIAICFVRGANIDRIADIAEILFAKMVFRKSTKEGWLLIYSMATEDLRKFKRLALRDASEIVCP